MRNHRIKFDEKVTCEHCGELTMRRNEKLYRIMLTVFLITGPPMLFFMSFSKKGSVPEEVMKFLEFFPNWFLQLFAILFIGSLAVL